ncbi:MAG: peptide deformylase [Candidatus Cloacimonetes bacterium]|nr:peptide deformylase [Candidatus Cloacimonadota bacterium]
MKSKPEVLPVRVIGDKILRTKALDVLDDSEELQEFIQDLILTMYEDDGVGLAAPQVGKSLRIFVVDPYWYREGHEKNPLVFINPEFKEFSGEDIEDEGCLSLPGIYAKVPRAERVIIEGLNEKFKKIRFEAEDMFARSLQHEYDHLDGILFIDKVAPLQRAMFVRKLKELESGTDENGVNIKRKEHEDN